MAGFYYLNFEREIVVKGLEIRKKWIE